jgi:hypothetical protein
LFIADLHGQKFHVSAASHPPFAILFPPVETVIRVHLVPPGHSRHRHPRRQGRHDLAPLSAAASRFGFLEPYAYGRLGTKNTFSGSLETTFFDNRHEHFELHQFHSPYSVLSHLGRKWKRPSSLSDDGPGTGSFVCAGRYPVSAFLVIREIKMASEVTIPTG